MVAITGIGYSLSRAKRNIFWGFRKIEKNLAGLLVRPEHNEIKDKSYLLIYVSRFVFVYFACFS